MTTPTPDIADSIAAGTTGIGAVLAEGNTVGRDDLAAARARRAGEMPITMGVAVQAILEQLVADMTTHKHDDLDGRHDPYDQRDDRIAHDVQSIMLLAHHHRGEFWHESTLHVSTCLRLDQLDTEVLAATTDEPAMSLRDLMVEGAGTAAHEVATRHRFGAS